MTNQEIENKLKELSKKLCCKIRYYNTFEEFPTTGTSNILYVDNSTGSIYIWNGSTYVTAPTGGEDNYIETVYSYTDLRELTDYNPDVVFVNDFSYTGPDGKLYTTLGGFFKKSDYVPEDGATFIYTDDGTTWERVWDKIHVQPEWWECGGYDRNGVLYTNKNTSKLGIYNEADRLHNAARFVFENKGSVVLLQNREYLVDRPITLSSTIGNGATIKSDRPASTTNTVAYTSGQTTITVADASGYRVGMSVILTKSDTPYLGLGYGENISDASNIEYEITNITGNVITINNAGVQSVGIGNNFSSLITIGLITNESIITDVTFDGVYSTNTNTLDWRYTGFIVGLGNSASIAGGNNIHFERCRFNNIIGTAVTSSSFRITNCSADTIGGGVLHYSADTHVPTGADNEFVMVDGLEVANVGLENPYASQHQEAIFTFSANSRNFKLNNIKGRNVRSAIFGTVQEGNHIIELSNSTFEGYVPTWASESTPFVLARIQTSSIPVQEKQQKAIRITNCSFNTCGDLLLWGNTLETGGFVPNVIIDGCKFNNVRIHGLNTSGVRITNNVFTNEPFANHTGYTYRTSNNGLFTTAQIAINHSDRVTICNNYIEGPKTYNALCDYGIQTQLKKVFRKNSVGTNTKIWFCSNIKINDNTVTRYSFPIGHLQRLDDQMAGWNAGHAQWGNGTHIGNEISRNSIAFHKDTQYDPTHRIIWGIMALQGTTIESNTIYHPLNAPVNTMRAIVIWGISTAEKPNLFGGAVRNNYIWGPMSGNDIVIGTGSGGDDMEDNIIVQGNATSGAVYAPKGYQSNNYRLQATAFAHLTTPYMNPDLSGFLENTNQY